MEELEPIPALLQGLAEKLGKVQQAGSAKKNGRAKQKEITGWGAEQRKLTHQSKALTIQVVAARAGLGTWTEQMHREVPPDTLK